MLQDGINGSVSSKRVITFLAFILCSIAFISNLFFGLKIDQFIYDSMTYIVMAGLGVTVAEKFTKPEPFKHSYYQPTRGTPLPIQKDPLI
jgi:hypothetical protein